MEEIQNEKSKSYMKIWLPIAFSCAVVVGVLVGNILANNAQEGKNACERSSSDGKIDMLMNLIDIQYVDTVDRDELTEKVIPEILSNLDPHSVYIPADELQMVNDDLGASFSGIGVQFNIQRDTIMVIAVVHGGPSERLGLMPGDRIVEVNDTAFVGKDINSDMVVKKLRGPKGTKVKVGIVRFGTDEMLHYTITRGDVPTNSVDASYMLDDGLGYVKVSKFGSATYEEFYEALTKLKMQGATSYIVDLRENSGGYLESAIAMINEFLHAGDMIVYTKGKAQKREDAVADGSGEFQDVPLAVLIDEWSASASEIFAGAIQDNDRGIVVGVRSFGKGLVQQQIPMRDGSAVRLTIARYYTPSGRCIQKPYTNKDEYEKEVFNRYESGELLSADSVKTAADSVKYYTTGGRVVYGGGGIMPDIFAARDTTGRCPYYVRLWNSGAIYEYAFRYVDEHRAALSAMDKTTLVAHLDKQPLLEKMLEFGKSKKIEPKETLTSDNKKLIVRRLKEYIVRDVLGDEAFFEVLNETDNVVRAAQVELEKQKSK